MSAPRISVVIPSHNAAATLGDLLADLENQSLAPEDYEVLVVDDGSSDGTADLAEGFAPARCLRQPQSGPGIARNLGVSHSRAPVVLFLDSDLRAPRDLLAAHLEFHAGHPEVHAVGGAVLAARPMRLFSWEMADHLSSWFNAHPDSGNPLGRDYLPSLNFSIKRDYVLGELGLSWISGLEHTGEDVVFCSQLRGGGGKLCFLPSAVVRHRDRQDFKGYWRHMHNWGYHAPFVRGRLDNVSFGFLFPRHAWAQALAAPAIMLGYTGLVWASWLRARPLAATLALPQLLVGRLAYVLGVWRGGRKLRARGRAAA